ncbi:MAG: TetR/AcrR family transcriptional regulator [Actinomycetia bacterium]|nr:TetR/AcrR family transcriptional regulator [Actinomycetes bacterium]
MTESTMNPQAQRTQNLMLTAAQDLLSEHGAEAVTHLKVAQNAGVARATVYRHWPDRAAILVDLLRTNADIAPVPPDPGPALADRVTATLATFAKALNGDGGRTLAAMIGLAEWDEDVFAALERMTQFGPMLLRTIIADGIDDGSLVAGSDPGLVVDMLIGPLYFRRLLYHDHLDNTYIEALVRRTITPLLST